MSAGWLPAGAAPGLLRRLALVLAATPVIALAWSWLRGPGAAFDVVLAHTLGISLLSWAGTDAGRYLLRGVLRAGPPHYWPSPARAVLLMGLVLPLALLGGTAIGNLYAGVPVLRLPGAPGVATWLGFYLALSLGFTALFLGSARRERREREAREAHLAALQAQLEPHMLFNTLANLRALIEIDPPRAIAMLDRLNAFLRATLGGSLAARHALSEEVARIEDFLGLMGVRMGRRLMVSIEVPEALRGVMVPALILQPLVENAIRHGIEPLPEGGAIELRAVRDGDTLVLMLRDTGAGLPEGVAMRPGGFGLAQLRQRLATLHGRRAGLEVAPAPGGGTLATLRLPLEDA